jgi:hypothetical protein
MGAQLSGEEGREAARQVPLRRRAEVKLNHRSPIADEGDGACEGFGSHDAEQCLIPQPQGASRTHLLVLVLLKRLVLLRRLRELLLERLLLLLGLVLLQRLGVLLLQGLVLLLLLLLPLLRGQLAPHVGHRLTRSTRMRAGGAPMLSGHHGLPCCS